MGEYKLRIIDTAKLELESRHEHKALRRLSVLRSITWVDMTVHVESEKTMGKSPDWAVLIL